MSTSLIIIRHNRTASIAPTSLNTGELALNTGDGKLWYGDNNGNPQLIIEGSGSTFPYTGTAVINGGLIVTGSTTSTNGFTGSLQGTASWANNVTTASYALTAQTLLGSVISASYAATASVLLGSIESASYATTASYALTAQTLLGSVVSASYAATASYVSGIIIKSNVIAGGSFSGNPKIATVTFAAAFPNTNYSVVVTGEDSRTWTIESKLAGSFVINSNSSVALSNNVYWQAIKYGEFNG